MQMVDLALHLRESVQALQARLAELALHTRALGAEIANYDPDDLREGSVPSAVILGTAPEPQQNSYRPPKGHQAFAARLCFMALCEVLRMGLQDIILPFEVMRRTPVTPHGISRSDWNESVDTVQESLSRKTLGACIRLLKKAINASSDDDTHPEHTSLFAKLDRYRALRNCIVHRLGHVSPLDIGSDADELSIEWVGLHLALDGEIVAGVPVPAEAGQEVSLVQKHHSASWAVGETVNLSFDQVLSCHYDVIGVVAALGPLAARAAANRFDTLLAKARGGQKSAS